MFQVMRQSLVILALAAGSCLFTAERSWAGDEAVKQSDGCGHCDQCRAGSGRRGRRGQCANCRPYQYGQPDLFHNYYVPGTCGGVPAAMYVAPQPVPSHVGHTYYTYQPFMPHEMLYKHYRGYHRYYDGGRGLTRTRVIWK